MDIQAEKLQLIEWLIGLNDSNTIREIISLRKKEEKDWWSTISTEERSEIEQGLAEADRGEVVSHEEVMKKYNKWL